MRKIFFLLQLGHSHARVKSLFLVQTLILTGQGSTSWEKMPVSGKKLDFVSLEDEGLYHIVLWGVWFQGGLKCVQFPRTSTEREREKGLSLAKPVVKGLRGAWPGVLRPLLPASPVLGAALLCDSTQPRCLPGNVCSFPPPGPQHLATVPTCSAGPACAGGGQQTPEQLWVCPPSTPQTVAALPAWQCPGGNIVPAQLGQPACLQPGQQRCQTCNLF